MKKKLLLLSSSLLTVFGGMTLLSSPATAGAFHDDGCVEKAGCKVVENCYSGWTSTGQPVTWCECAYTCGPQG